MERIVFKRTMAGVVVAVVGVFGLSACGASNPAGGSSSSSSNSSGNPTIAVGVANFGESQVLGAIYVAALKGKGINATLNNPAGATRETYYKALQSGEIDLVPEYTGNLLLYVDKNATATSSDAVYTALQQALPSSLTVLDKATGEDKDAVVVTQATATKYSLKSIADLAPHCSSLTFGGPAEFQQRAYGVPGLAKKYNCTFKQFQPLDTSGTAIADSLKSGAIDAGDLFTTDPSIPSNNFVVLADPQNDFAAQNVVPLINKSKATDTVKQVLNAVSAKLDTKTLTQLDATLAGPDHPDPSQVASDWLKSVGLN
jgi:osmoprotectant transport system substrate-binding protein